MRRGATPACLGAYSLKVGEATLGLVTTAPNETMDALLAIPLTDRAQ
jgi:hypothetical protein